MSRKYRVKPHRRKNKKSQGKHFVRGHTRNLNVYVGGRSQIRLSDEKPSFDSGKRYPTDLKNCFHTSLRKDVPYTFVLEHGEDVYELNLDLDDVPNYKILRQEDWNPFMAMTFNKYQELPYNFLIKKRPDMEEYLQSQGFDKGDQITVEDLDDGLFDVFMYPSEETNDKMYEKGLMSVEEYRVPYEDEVAIFNMDVLEDAWENKRKLSEKEVRKADQEHYEKRKKYFKGAGSSIW